MGSVSIMRWGEPHRGLLSHVFSQQHPTWKFSAQEGLSLWLSDSSMVCVGRRGGGGGEVCTILFQTKGNSPGCFHEYLVIRHPRKSFCQAIPLFQCFPYQFPTPQIAVYRETVQPTPRLYFAVADPNGRLKNKTVPDRSEFLSK